MAMQYNAILKIGVFLSKSSRGRTDDYQPFENQVLNEIFGTLARLERAKRKSIDANITVQPQTNRIFLKWLRGKQSQEVRVFDG